MDSSSLLKTQLYYLPIYLVSYLKEEIMQISIITATYNRAYCLDNIYQSILRNKYNEEVEWILIDDGSTDNTEALAKKWSYEKKINFRYYKKSNGGKTSAIKLGFDNNPKGEFTFVLDSDDYLADNAIELILDELKGLDNKYIGIVGLKAFIDGKIVGEKFPIHESGYMNLYFGKNSISSDKLFVIKTDIYSASWELPIKGEKLLPEGVVYLNANSNGIYKLINEVFYYGDYLNDGLSNNVFKLAMNNINSFRYVYKRFQAEEVCLKSKFLIEAKYIHYSILCKKDFINTISYSENKAITLFMYLPVLIGLYPYRKKILRNVRDFS